METSTFTYNGKLWRQNPTTLNRNSFFHSAFGVTTNESRVYFDSKAKFRRMRWAAFLTYFENEAIPSRLANVLKKCLSANSKYDHVSLGDQGLEDYVFGIINGNQAITVEEIPILAALDNIKIVLFISGRSEPIIIHPDKAILEPQSSNEKSKGEVVLYLDRDVFSRLNPVEEDAPSAPLEDATVEVKGNKSRQSDSGLIKYKKGGSAGSEGVQFQIGLLTVFFLNALRKLSNWELSTENEAAGKFDDVVLEWPGGATLLQAKHKQSKTKKITLDDLISANSKNDDFSLPKYFLSFEEVKKKFPLKNVIICTNASVDGNTMKLLQASEIPSESMLHWEECQCQFYSFKNDILEKLKGNITSYYEKNSRSKNFSESAITDDNIKDFLGRLQLFINYPPGNDVGKITEQLLSHMKRLKNPYGEITPLEIHTKILDWFHQKDGVCLTELYSKAIYFEICRDRIWQILEKYNVLFHQNFIFQEPNKIFSISTDGGLHLLQELRIFCTLKKDKTTILYTKADDDIVARKHVIDAFALPKYTILVIVWTKDVEESILGEMTGKLSHILEKSSYKKLILVADRGNELARFVESSNSNYQIINETVTFDHMMEESQKMLSEKESVLFQGDDVSLEELLASQSTEDYGNFLDSETLEKLVRSDKIKVGAQPSQLSEDVAQVYVRRKFKKAIINDKGSRTTQTTEPQVTFSEEDICEMTEKVTLISDSAGTGKSTVLSNLAAAIKKKDPHLWVLRIDLNNYTKILKECLETNKKAINIMELLDSKYLTKFTNHLERSTFWMEGKIVLMLDGFDEIGPDFTQLLIGLLTVCRDQQNFSKLFVTTRPHVIKELVKLQKWSFELESFTREDQIQFFTNYWSRNLGLDDTAKSKCQRYAGALIRAVFLWIELHRQDQRQFAGIPLQSRMLAEIFQERGRSDQQLDWETCREFLDSEEIEPKLPADMNVMKLYQMFVQRKRSIFLDKGNPSGNPSANHALIDQFEECLAHQRILALELILGKEKCECFASYREGCRNVEVNTLKIGIVQKLDGEFHFLHRTFAEYFAAESVFRELQTGTTDVEFQRLLIEDILQDSRFAAVCGFLNGFLQDVVDDFPHTVFFRYQCTPYRIDSGKADKWKVFFHLAAGGHVAIFRLLLKCVNVVLEAPVISKQQLHEGVTYGNALNMALTIFLRKGFDMEDNFKTLLGHATEGNHLAMVKFLVERGANLGLGPRKPLHLAAKAHHFELFKFLVEQGANLESKDVFEYHTVFYKAIEDNEPVIVGYLLDRVLKKDGLNVRDPNVLYAAAFLGRLDMMEDLIERGADIDGKVEYEETPIFGAVRGGQLEAITFLARRKCNINARNTRNHTVLQAVRINQLQLSITKLLVELGLNINARNKHLDTVVHSAIISNDYDLVELLVTVGADLHLVDMKGATALHIAASTFQRNIVQLLVKHGVRLDARDKRGSTPLHVVTWTKFTLEPDRYVIGADAFEKPAYLKDRMDIIRIIVEAGGDVNSVDHSGHTPLHLAAKTNPLDMVALFVELQADVDVRDEEGKTALYFAALEGKADVVKLLLQHNADVNIKDNSGQTVVQHLASSGKHGDILRLILESGKDVNTGDNATALHLAAGSGTLDTLAVLVESGIDPNIKDEDGSTALHLAVRHGDLRAVEYVTKSGVDITLKDNKGCTALHLAAKGDYSIVADATTREETQPILDKLRRFLTDEVMQFYLPEDSAFSSFHDRLLESVDTITLPEEYAEASTSTKTLKPTDNTTKEVTSVDGNGATPGYESAACLKLLEIIGKMDHLSLFAVEDCIRAEVRNLNDAMTLVHNICGDAVVCSQGNKRLMRSDVFKAAVETEATKITLDIAKSLVAETTDIVDIKNDNGHTALQLAAKTGKLEVVKFLVEKGASVNSRDDKGCTALHVAARDGELKTVEVLVAACSAEVNIVDNGGRTASHEAASQGQLEILQLLVDNGIDLEIRDNEGRTPLHLAALGRFNCGSRTIGVSGEAKSEAYLKVVEFLVEKGADICSEDFNGDTAAMLAGREGHLEVLRSLEILLNAKLTENEV